MQQPRNLVPVKLAPEQLKQLRKWLRKASFAVTEAHDGQCALVVLDAQDTVTRMKRAGEVTERDLRGLMGLQAALSAVVSERMRREADRDATAWRSDLALDCMELVAALAVGAPIVHGLMHAMGR